MDRRLASMVATAVAGATLTVSFAPWGQAAEAGTARAASKASPAAILERVGAATVELSVPAIAFGPAEPASPGQVRLVVLLTDPEVTAHVAFVGAPAGRGCSADLQQGIPVQLDCAPLPGDGRPAHVLVTLSDGRTASTVVVAG